MRYFLATMIMMAASFATVLGECSASERKALMDFDHAWGNATMAGDKAALSGIYADDFSGMPDLQGKTAAIDGAMRASERNKANPEAANKTTWDHYRISCTANSATITHRNTVWTPNGEGGKPQTYYTRSVHILEKRGGKWQVVSNAGSGLDDYDVLWYLEQDWNDAVLKKDGAWFEKNFASDFSSISSVSAKRFNKAEDIADSIDAKLTMEVVETTDMNIRIDGNNAIITGIFRTKGKDDKGAFDRKTRYTDVWIRRDGRWQAWSSQGTVIPSSPEMAKNQ
jgi:ketosteroid isomerase-like protein